MIQKNHPITGRPVQNPYERYDHLGSEDQVHWSEGSQVCLGSNAVSRRHECAEGSRPSSTSFSALIQEASGGQTFEALEQTFMEMMIFRNPPDDTRLRSLANKAFTPGVLERIRSQVHDSADLLLNDVRKKGSVEVVSELAYPLPALVISEVLGVADRDREKFKK